MIFSDFLFNHQISIIAPVSFVSKPPWNQEHTQKKEPNINVLERLGF